MHLIDFSPLVFIRKAQEEMPRHAASITPDNSTANGDVPIGRHALEQALGEQLNALLSASRALMVEAAATFHPDVPPAAFHIAYRLHAFGADKVSVVAEAVAMDRSATSRLAARLIELELIAAHPDPNDGRGVVLELTASGRARVDQAIAYKGDIFQQKIKTWNDADLELLTVFLKRLAT